MDDTSTVANLSDAQEGAANLNTTQQQELTEAQAGVAIITFYLILVASL